MKEKIVCVHGIWMHGLAMRPLSNKLQKLGYDCSQFSYHSISKSPQENALALIEFVSKLDADIVHFVAHSLGGIVVLHFFRQIAQPKPGKVILLGTPIKGSAVARLISRNYFLQRALLGRSSISLIGHVPSWAGTRPLAVIAGTKGVGIGVLLGTPLDTPNDGTVAVSETLLPNSTCHFTVPRTHTGMLLSADVAQLIDAFIRDKKD